MGFVWVKEVDSPSTAKLFASLSINFRRWNNPVEVSPNYESDDDDKVSIKVGSSIDYYDLIFYS